MASLLARVIAIETVVSLLPLFAEVGEADGSDLLELCHTVAAFHYPGGDGYDVRHAALVACGTAED